MAGGEGAIFLCHLQMFSGIKCHTVNVKGGEVITCAAVSLSSSVLLRLSVCLSVFSNPQRVSSSAVFEALLHLLLDCHQHLALRPGFTPQYACTHTLTHTSQTPPFILALWHTYTHANQLPLCACFKEITEASRERERGGIS